MKRFLTLVAIIAAVTVGWSGIAVPRAFADTSCKVLSATFTPGLNLESSSMDVNPDQGQQFFLDDHPPTVTITITTENCANQDIYVSLREGSGLAGALGLASMDFVSELKYKKYTVPQSNSFTITAQAGETSCMQNAGDPDCRYYLLASPSIGIFDMNGFFSQGKPQGLLAYECNGACDESWSIISDTSVDGQQNSVTLDQGDMPTDPATTCTDESGKPIAGCYKIYDGLASILDKIGQKITVVTGAESLGGFFNGIFALIIGIGGICAVIMIMYYGYRYIFTRQQGKSSEMDSAKQGLFKAVIGFLLLLSIYVILRTINPDMLRLVPRIDTSAFDTGGDTPDPLTPQQVQNIQQNASQYAIMCPGSGGAAALPSIAQSFVGKVTYRFGAKGSTCPGNTLCFDCSGYVSAVYACAGLPNPGWGTANIFSGTTAIASITNLTVNNSPLGVGDLIGWVKGSLTAGKAERAGHVVMYIGNGKTIEATSGNGGKSAGKGVQIQDAGVYGQRLKFWKKAP